MDGCSREVCENLRRYTCLRLSTRDQITNNGTHPGATAEGNEFQL